MSTISLCIIAKNGGSSLENMLSSLNHLVDEIIIVDTGSTDNTIEIANKYGAIIINSTFENDFSSCRNLSIKQATKDWILYLDCDELIYIDDIPTFKKILDNKNYVAVNFKLENVINNVSYTAGNVLRLFRNNFNFKFEGKLHEQILQSIYKDFNIENIFFSDYVVQHFGYDTSSDKLLNKHNRNINILNSYTEDEKDGFYYFNLGNEYLSINNYYQANKYYAISKSLPDNNLNFKINLAYNHCRCSYELKDYTETISLCNSYLMSYPKYADLYFVLAICYTAIGSKNLSLINLNYYKNYIKSSIYPNHNLDKINNIDKLIDTIKNRS